MIIDLLSNRARAVNDYMPTTPTRTDRRHHMTDEQPPPRLALTGLQRDRIGFARQDLEDARAVNLTQMPAAGLVLLVEKLRRRLDDTLKVVDEITAPGPSDTN